MASIATAAAALDVLNPALPFGRKLDRAISKLWDIWVTTPDTHFLVKESAIKWYPLVTGK
jgi:hypothetical protein